MQAEGNRQLCIAAAITLYLYRFFYASGQAITGALAVAYIGYSFGLVVLEYLICHKRDWKKAISSDTSTFVFKSVILIAFAAYAEAWSYGVTIENSPVKFALGLLLLLAFRLFCLECLLVSSNSKDQTL